MLTDDATIETTPEVTPRPTALEWGGPAPEGVTLAWGARAIYALKSHDTKRAWAPRGKKGRVLVKAYTECMIDLLWDRQSMIGTEPDAERERFGRWLNGKAIPAIRRACIKDWISSDDDRTVTFVDAEAGYAIKASPRSSYGYLYLTAWKVTP